MKLVTILATALYAIASASAQTPSPQTTFTDPANLRGERVAPLNGHELPIDTGALGLQQLLRKLNTRASLMLIVAHPDDEDGGMLTLYSRGLGARVADLALNRGEGGQNAMTGDFEDALGLIRTQELLSADRYFDASQMFGTEVDFGFSKTKEEAFTKWSHQRVLYDVVRAIRLYRPLVIASVFIGGVTDGHGQHQVAGEIAQEAFVAAADPKVFPELTAEGILPWAPLKVYARVPRQAVTAQGLFDYATSQYTPARFTNYVTGAVTTTIPSADVVIHEGAPDPLLTLAGANPADLRVNAAPRNESASSDAPLSYVQFARIGLGLQRSQIGPGMRLPSPGAFDIAYHLYGSRLCNAPADARLPSTSPTNSPADSPTNCHLDRSLAASPQGAVERPAASPAAAIPSGDPNHDHDTASFFDGIDTTIEGIADLAPNPPQFLRDGLAQLQSLINTAAAQFNPATPSSIAPLLAQTIKQDDRLLAQLRASAIPTDAKTSLLQELLIKRVQLNDALVLSLGLTLDAQPFDPTLPITAGQPLTVSVKLDHPPSVSVPQPCCGMHMLLQGSAEPVTGPMEAKAVPTPTGWQATIPVASFLREPRPYFSRYNIEQPFYNIADPRLRLAPQTPPALIAIAAFDYDGAAINVTHTVNVIHRYPSGQTISEPAAVVPPVSVTLASHANVVPISLRTLTAVPGSSPMFPAIFSIAAQVRNTAAQPFSGVLNLAPPAGWSMTTRSVPFELPAFAPPFSAPAEIHDFQQSVSGPMNDHISAWVHASANKNYEEGFRPVGYPGLITTNYFTPATARIVPVDLKLPPPDHRRIAYLPGTGDAVPEALASIGLTPTILTVADLTPDKLKAYDTVILGVRTYNAHPDLHGAPTQALLDFARKGGNVLVQYQTDEFTAADAPYPLTLGRAAEKVVDETAPVKLLDPSSPLLTTPNRITPGDFNSWVEERGHGFLHTWDPHYTALTETHDPGVSGASGSETAPQAPQLGGLVTTKLGKGRWTYCAFALYRQLPEAIPGAYRLFVNLLNP